MANPAGKSGPFNPAIGTGVPMPGVVIGVRPADLTSVATSGTWQKAALGNFIGVQSNKMGNYYQAQPQTADFTPDFKAVMADESLGLSVGSYELNGPPDHYRFKSTATAAAATTQTTTVSHDNQTYVDGDTVTVNVADQYGRPMAGVAVAFAKTGGTATGGATAPASANTDIGGNATTKVTATAAGTVIGTATVSGITAQTFTATLIDVPPPPEEDDEQEEGRGRGSR
jgi:Bacterial Ig-like domain (group 1)